MAQDLGVEMADKAERDREARRALIIAGRDSEERRTRIKRNEDEKAAAEAKRRSSQSADARRTPENTSTYHGHPWPEWYEMRDHGYAFLKERARERRTATYGELWAAIQLAMGKDLGNQRWQIARLLGAISEHAFAESGLEPTALVVYDKGASSPGPGFFRLMASKGLLSESDAPPDGDGPFEMTRAQRAFWEAHREQLFERFATGD